MILRQIEKRHTGRANIDDAFFTEVKNGRTQGNRELLKLDALAIRKSWVKPCFTGYEIKVSRGDFMRDDKWSGYLKCCHEFYFVCPAGLIQPEELPVEVGLIYYNSDKNSISTKRKAVHRIIEIPSDILMYLLMYRTGSDRHPFFNDKREYFEALVRDKADKKSLGYRVSGKTKEILDGLEIEIRDLKRKINIMEPWSDRYAQTIKIFRECGIIFSRWDYENELKGILGELGLTPKIRSTLEKMKHQITELLGGQL